MILESSRSIDPFDLMDDQELSDREEQSDRFAEDVEADSDDIGYVVYGSQFGLQHPTAGEVYGTLDDAKAAYKKYTDNPYHDAILICPRSTTT